MSVIIRLLKGSHEHTLHMLDVEAHSLIRALELALLDCCSDINVQHPRDHCARQSCSICQILVFE